MLSPALSFGLAPAPAKADKHRGDTGYHSFCVYQRLSQTLLIFTWIFCSVSGTVSRSKRSPPSSFVNQNIVPQAIQCFYPKCIPPPPPPPPGRRPLEFSLWSDPETWKYTPAGDEKSMNERLLCCFCHYFNYDCCHQRFHFHQVQFLHNSSANSFKFLHQNYLFLNILKNVNLGAGHVTL